MAEPLKNIYNQAFFNRLLKSIIAVKPEFNSAAFLEEVYDDQWENRELKQRMRHITICLKQQLGNNYKENVQTLLALIPVLRNEGYKSDNLAFVFLPDFIELYGQNDYETSIHAIENITQFVSCEFAIRPFIIQNPEATLGVMLKWSKHENLHVRRLSSEGCRPRLPWAMALPALKKDPGPILPILENLKNNESEYVRRSVANNLNDISKDNPEVIIDIIKRWNGTTPETNWIAKHASRTLLKQGNSDVMQLFGFGDVNHLKVIDFVVLTPKVKIGENMTFSFKILNPKNIPSKVRVEYGIYYQKSNGSLSRKVFKICEKVYKGSTPSEIIRKQSFKLITTRKFHLGKHQVSVILNGVELEKKDFELV